MDRRERAIASMLPQARRNAVCRTAGTSLSRLTSPTPTTRRASTPCSNTATQSSASRASRRRPSPRTASSSPPAPPRPAQPKIPARVRASTSRPVPSRPFRSFRLVAVLLPAPAGAQDWFGDGASVRISGVLAIFQSKTLAAHYLEVDRASVSGTRRVGAQKLRLRRRETPFGL